MAGAVSSILASSSSLVIEGVHDCAGFKNKLMGFMVFLTCENKQQSVLRLIREYEANYAL
jgi:hypothetical protein